VRLAARVGGGRLVAVNHLPGAPTGETHQVTFAAAGGAPVVRERVAEQVGVQVHADLLAATLEELPHPVCGQRSFALLPQPQHRQGGERVPGAFAQIAVERQGSGRGAGGDQVVEELTHIAGG